jgi:alpha-L-rhamnosidase
VQVREAFQSRFVSADVTVGAGTQTAYVLALQFNLLLEEQRAAAARRLVEEIRRAGHLTTGFLGTPGLLFALSENGYLDEAYGLLMRKEYPSWLYPVTRGATTMWERWDGIKPDGSFQTATMNSFNHYAYGAVGEWMYRVVGGINVDPTAPGYKHILVRPRPGGDLTYARARHLTPYGNVSSSWSIASGRIRLAVEVPPNTTATVSLPCAKQRELLEGGKVIGTSGGVTTVKQVGRNVVVEVGSGRYDFSYSWPPS